MFFFTGRDEILLMLVVIFLCFVLPVLPWFVARRWRKAKR